VGAELATRFREAQVGSVRPALTVSDGATVVTDNYLKLPIPPGRRRNERLQVLVTDVGPSLPV